MIGNEPFFNLDLAGFICQLEVKNSKWRDCLREKFKAFLLQKGKPDLRFLILPSKKFTDISLKFSRNSNEIIVYCPRNLNFFKRLNFYLKVGAADFLLNENAFLLHASSFIKDNRGYLFSGKRRAGKSTIIKLSHSSSGVYLLNDDFSLVRRLKEDHYVFSTPFYETTPINKKPKKAQIKAIYFPIQSDKNNLERVIPHKALPILASNILSSLNMPDVKRYHSNKETLGLIWSAASRVVGKVPCYNLYFKKDGSFLRLIK